MSVFVKSFDLFVDRENVKRQLGRRNVRILKRVGGVGRTSMRRLIRRSKRSAKPGEPPRAHWPGGSGMKAIFFALDKDDKRPSVVVGPLLFQPHKQTGTFWQIADKPVPALLEFGGTAIRVQIGKRGGRKERKLRYRQFPYRRLPLQLAADEMVKQMQRGR